MPSLTQNSLPLEYIFVWLVAFLYFSFSEFISHFCILPCFSPIRSLIEEGFSADKRSNVRLYYGARNLSRMAYLVLYSLFMKIITVLFNFYKGFRDICFKLPLVLRSLNYTDASKFLQERFKAWQSSGVNIVPVLSQPDDSWTGVRGYVQVISL